MIKNLKLTGNVTKVEQASIEISGDELKRAIREQLTLDDSIDLVIDKIFSFLKLPGDARTRERYKGSLTTGYEIVCDERDHRHGSVGTDTLREDPSQLELSGLELVTFLRSFAIDVIKDKELK